MTGSDGEDGGSKGEDREGDEGIEDDREEMSATEPPRITLAEVIRVCTNIVLDWH